MQKLNLIYSLIGLCFCFLNCLYSVKPNYKIEKFEATTKPKAEVRYITVSQRSGATKWSVKTDLSNVIDFTEYSESDKDKIQISIRGGAGENEDTFGKIGFINFCILIPCWKSNRYSISVDYSIDGETKKEDNFTEEQTLWIWSPLVFYNIFTRSSEKGDIEERNFSRFLKAISPNIAKSILSMKPIIEERIAERQLKKQKEVSEWEKVNKNSVRDLVHYLQNANEGELKDQAKKFRNNLFDKKVQTYLVNHYPFVKPYLKNMVLYPDGSSAGSYQFFEIFTRLVLEKDSETGFKQDVKLFQKEGKIIWEIEYQGETHLLYFVPYKNNITLEKISRDGITLVLHYRVNGPDDGIFRAALLYDRFSSYPLWKDLDIDFLDSFK
ncbi:hypothetical protein [Leptospira alstonii]|uniref:Uncharacterized protein n=2 Tax=Leptospira alstonii TaxID=28452 RepID=M6CIS9_9LEPT|nr:hypothetical protein [Leptospira alstonii]EMJ91792.1 hypothetical protein LEP1GSC194_1529 [Leptospira alstonii serovar Sichuan str. 79601]EQA82125.1 hypothetical protein LEP1GSC193_0343 [Leptospira alstonii serovar Pingchang str. 80-412]